MGVSATGNGADYSYLGYGPAARLCPAWREHRPPGVWYPGIPVIQALLWQSLGDSPAHFQPHIEALLSYSMCIVCPHLVVYSTWYQSIVILFQRQGCGKSCFCNCVLRTLARNPSCHQRMWIPSGVILSAFVSPWGRVVFGGQLNCHAQKLHSWHDRQQWLISWGHIPLAVPQTSFSLLTSSH